jgi:outer membrane protein TolC/ABC-type uncharacterized transport system substrate-binding protein
MVLDGPWDRNEEIVQLFQREISDLLEGEFGVSFPPAKQEIADFTMDGIQGALNRVLEDQEVDLVVALGPLVSTISAKRGPFPKPVVAPFVVGAWMTDLDMGYVTSGVRNLTYIIVPEVLERDVGVFHEIVSFSKMALLAPNAFSQCIPHDHITDYSALHELGVTDVTEIYVNESADEVLDQIPADVDAVYMVPLMTFSDAEFDKLVQGLTERELPSFSQLGRMDVERGVLAGLSTDALIDQRARRVALIVQQIVLGDLPESIPVTITTEPRLSINMTTSRAIGVCPSWDIINEADLVDEMRLDVERRLTLGLAMREALKANLDLKAKLHEVEAGAQSVNVARSSFLPQVDVGATGTLIDKDRASASCGQAAEKTYSGSAGFSQLIFGEGALANLGVQRHLQHGRERELESFRLDIAQDAALAYLNVLSAHALERIERENLKLTRENLERARVRSAVGSAGPAEVYRWEAEIARGRQDVITANSQRNLAEIALNRILHRPLEELFLPEEVTMDDPDLLLRLAPPTVYADNRENFRLLRNFMADEALSISPDLKQLDAAIAAQKRFLKSQGWRYYLPTFALQGSVENIFDKQGAGADTGFDLSGLPTELSALGSVFPEPADDTSWQVGLSLSIPLFRGGGHFAAQRGAGEELERLEHQRAAVAEGIEERVRSALHMSGASHASIRLSREAAEAAAKTLDVVKDAYSRGAVSILALLDAQNAALVTEAAAAIAIYQFLVDYMRTQRAVGRFDVFTSEEEKRRVVERLERYILDNGGTLPHS